MFSAHKQKQRPDYESFPTSQLLILALIRVSEPIALTSIFPYAWRLVLHFQFGDASQAPFYAGILISTFSLAEALSGLYWGGLSDRIGRRPVILMGCLGTVLSLLVVGLSTNFWIALAGRALGGLLNGNIGVVQTMVGELVVNPKHEPRAYAIMPFVWSIGTIVGPAVGGYFAQPSENNPAMFPPGSLFDRFPYLLPNLICAALMLCSIAAGWFMLEETHPDMQPWSAVDGDNSHNGLDESCSSHHTVETALLPSQASMTTSGVDLAQQASYGTFAAVEADKVEEWTVDANGRPVSIDCSLADKIYTKRVVMLVLAMGIFTYHSMTYDHLLPIFLQERRLGTEFTVQGSGALAGGLGMTTQQVGVIMSMDGVLALFIQAAVFPLTAGWLGIWRTFMVVTVLHPLSYLVVPWLTLLPEHLVYAGILGCLALRNVLSIMAFPVLLILIKEAAPSNSCLGKINGLTASTGAACRTVASPLAGYLYGVGLRIDFTALAWFGSALVAVMGAVQAFFIHQEKASEVHHVVARPPCASAFDEVAKHDLVHIMVHEIGVEDEDDAQYTETMTERQALLA